MTSWKSLTNRAGSGSAAGTISGSGPDCNGTITLDEIEIRKKVTFKLNDLLLAKSHTWATLRKVQNPYQCKGSADTDPDPYQKATDAIHKNINEEQRMFSFLKWILNTSLSNDDIGQFAYIHHTGRKKTFHKPCLPWKLSILGRYELNVSAKNLVPDPHWNQCGSTTLGSRVG